MGGVRLRKNRLAVGAATLAFLGVIVGCARPPICPSGTAYYTSQFARRPAEPKLLAPTVGPSAQPESSDVQGPPRYCALTAEQCRRLAAEFAPKAVRREIDVLIAADIACDHGCCRQAFGAMQRDLLALQAVGERNLAAAQALETFYALLEAEQDLLRVGPSLQEIQAMEAFVSEAKARGIALAGDTSTLARLRLDLCQRQADSELLCRQLNDRLKLMLGWDLSDKSRFWPTCDVTVSHAPIDVKEAVECGLARRTELVQLRVLISGLSACTLPLARTLIAQADGTTAALPPGLRDMRSDRDLHLRKEQLEHLLAQREQAAIVEITEAVAAIETRWRGVALAQQKVESWRKRLVELERQQAAGRANRLDTGLARLDALAAERALFHEVIAYKTAQVRLAAAQGLLASEPGEPFTPESAPW